MTHTIKNRQFTRENLAVLRGEIDAALNQIAKRHGIDYLKTGHVGYQYDRFTCRIEGKFLPVAGQAPTDHDILKSKMLGFDACVIGQEFKANGRDFTIVDLMLNRPKYPIVATCKQDGKDYKFNADSVRILLNF